MQHQQGVGELRDERKSRSKEKEEGDGIETWKKISDSKLNWANRRRIAGNTNNLPFAKLAVLPLF